MILRFVPQSSQASLQQMSPGRGAALDVGTITHSGCAGNHSSQRHQLCPAEWRRCWGDIESPARRSGAFGGLLGFLIVSPPLPASMARSEAPSRMVTLRVGSSLASPSGLRFSLSLRSTMTPVGSPATSCSVPSGNRRSTKRRPTWPIHPLPLTVRLMSRATRPVSTQLTGMPSSSTSSVSTTASVRSRIGTPTPGRHDRPGPGGPPARWSDRAIDGGPAPRMPSPSVSASHCGCWGRRGTQFSGSGLSGTELG